MGEITAEGSDGASDAQYYYAGGVGSQAEVEPEIRHVHPRAGDLYLLASDGLTRELSDSAIAKTIVRAVAREKVRTRPDQEFLDSVCQTLGGPGERRGGWG